MYSFSQSALVWVLRDSYLVCVYICANYSVWRGLGSWKFPLKIKRVFATVHGPGPGMAHAPRAGTGHSTCRSWRYWFATMWNRQGNLSMCGTFLIRLLLPLNNRGWQLKHACLQAVYASFCESQPMGLFLLTTVRFGSESLNCCGMLKQRDYWGPTILDISLLPSPRSGQEWWFFLNPFLGKIYRQASGQSSWQIYIYTCTDTYMYW